MHSTSLFKVPNHVELLHPPLLFLSHMARTSQQLPPLSLTDSAQSMLRYLISFLLQFIREIAIMTSLIAWHVGYHSSLQQ